MANFPKGRSIHDRVLRGITFFLRLNLVVEIAYSAYAQNWIVLFASALILFSTFLPLLIERKYRIEIPLDLEFAVILFLYASLFLGEVRGYFTLFWWWDILLHISGGIALGFIGFIVLYILYYKNKLSANPFLVAIFSFFFALGIGALWEIFEFGMDSFFGLNMQKSGLVDTMWDLIVDAGGALLTSAVGYFYIKKKRGSVFSWLIRKIIAENKL